jgi:two-component system cell cycle sensor histidine kinase/response regulator CckA
MKDKYKKKDQLLEELKILSDRLADLEQKEIKRKQNEDIFKEKEHFLKNILNSIQNGISILDKNLNILLVNETMKKWYAHQLPLSGKKCYEAYQGRTDPCENCPSIRTLNSKKQDIEVVPLTGPTGIKGWLELYTFPFIDSKTGELIGVIEYVHNITDRLNTEQKILQAKKEWEHTFNTIKDLIFITDREGVVRLVNRALSDKLGVQPQDLIGKTCWQIFRCENKGTEKCSLTKIQQGLSIREHEAKIPLLGMWVIAHVYAAYTPSNELAYIIHTYRDITEHKRLEEQLLQFQKTEAVARLAGGVAHEFNNLLTVIIGNLSLTKTQLIKESEEYRFIENAYTAAEKASGLVKNLLAFSGKLQFTYNLASINDVVLKVVSLLRETTDPRIKILVYIDKDPWTVMADPSQINKLLISLLMNARDAITECIEGLFKHECKEKEPFVITISVKNVKVDDKYCKSHVDARPGEFVLITISDNGPGMDLETKQRIFEPFFTTREMTRGKGLGLAAVYGIVKQYHGWIDVSSELGDGATFSIYLPRAKPL